MTSNTIQKPLVPNADMQRRWVAKHMADSTQRRSPGGSGTLEPASLDPVNARLASVHYFDAWHRVTFEGKPAMMPIAPDVLLQFIADHAEGLTEDVVEAIEAQRPPRSGGRRYPATIESRVGHVTEAHAIEGLDDPADDVEVRKALRASRN